MVSDGSAGRLPLGSIQASARSAHQEPSMCAGDGRSIQTRRPAESATALPLISPWARLHLFRGSHLDWPHHRATFRAPKPAATKFTKTESRVAAQRLPPARNQQSARGDIFHQAAGRALEQFSIVGENAQCFRLFPQRGDARGERVNRVMAPVRCVGFVWVFHLGSESNGDPRFLIRTTASVR